MFTVDVTRKWNSHNAIYFPKDRPIFRLHWWLTSVDLLVSFSGLQNECNFCWSSVFPSEDRIVSHNLFFVTLTCASFNESRPPLPHVIVEALPMWRFIYKDFILQRIYTRNRNMFNLKLSNADEWYGAISRNAACISGYVCKVAQLLNKSPTAHGARRFITVFTRVRHFITLWTRWIQYDQFNVMS